MLQDCHPVKVWMQAYQISDFSKEAKYLDLFTVEKIQLLKALCWPNEKSVHQIMPEAGQFAL